MRNLMFGILIGICLPLLAGALFVLCGGMPVATKGSPLPMERWIAKTALHKAMKSEIDKPSPVTTEEANLLDGAKIYMNHCAVCHGDSSGKPSLIAMGLFPKPPQLLDLDHAVTDDPVGESYWKIKNGIRLTGMPGFVDNLSEVELWQVSQLVANVDKLTPDVKKILAPKAP